MLLAAGMVTVGVGGQGAGEVAAGADLRADVRADPWKRGNLLSFCQQPGGSLLLLTAVTTEEP